MILEKIKKEQSIEFLMMTPFGKEMEKAMGVLEDVQKNIYALSDKNGEESLTAIKCGTVLVLAMLKKIAAGKQPKQFDQTDWAEIANEVSEFAIRSDNQNYSEFVFLLYAKYIDFYASVIEIKAGKNATSSIHNLAASLREETEALRTGLISEVTYIDRCLWISLEAMIKLLASMMNVVAGESAERLAEALASFSFEYGRYQLVRKEQSLLEEFLSNQLILDKELEEKYEAFIKDLQADAESFMNLVDSAFASNFGELLMNSAKLASYVGVSEQEVLDSMEKLDAYLME